MEVSFGANYINKASVVKMPNKMPTRVEAAIVELDPKNYGDWFALEAFVEDNAGGKYATDIKNSFIDVMNGIIVNNNLHHYMLTLQNSDFEHLDPLAVLGTCMVVKKLKLSPKRKESLGVQTEHATKIRFLQGAPKNHYGNVDREYSETGKAIRDFVVNNEKEDDILVHVDKAAIPFYTAQGFEPCPNPCAADMMIYHIRKKK